MHVVAATVEAHLRPPQRPLAGEELALVQAAAPVPEAHLAAAVEAARQDAPLLHQGLAALPEGSSGAPRARWHEPAQPVPEVAQPAERDAAQPVQDGPALEPAAAGAQPEAAERPPDAAQPEAAGAAGPVAEAAREERYQKITRIGGGAYGTVWLALDTQTQSHVALKQLNMDEGDGQLADGVPAHVIREVSILRDLRHPNIAQLLDVETSGLGDYNLILEWIPMDLHRLQREERHQRRHLPMETVVRFSRDLLSGVHACHARLVIHRDLKPQNLLVGPGGLKICDFGMARTYGLPLRHYTHEVITLWYRALEILLGQQRYGPEVDIWSSGCIIAEMATGQALFPGDSEIDTIFRILRLLGSPTEETWPGFRARLQHWKETFPQWPARGVEHLRQQRAELPEEALALLRQLLSLNPQGRCSARRATNHPFVAVAN